MIGREEKDVVVLWDIESLCSTTMNACSLPAEEGKISVTACSFVLRNVQQGLPPHGPRSIQLDACFPGLYQDKHTARVMRCHNQQPAWTAIHHSPVPIIKISVIQLESRTMFDGAGLFPLLNAQPFLANTFSHRGATMTRTVQLFLLGRFGWHDWDSLTSRQCGGWRGFNSYFQGTTTNFVSCCLGMSSNKIHLLLRFLEAQPRSHD
ncbi:hypothetical protein GE09DRAFT_152812 [Coniochaeta sp. 2T2.1]|nr:hypothetical protein GE09DRAFT_152812 [Coniochaeta sp. 2T2.1]